MHANLDLPCRCGAVVSVQPAQAGQDALWLVRAPATQGGAGAPFSPDKIVTAHRMHECPSCKRLLVVDNAGDVQTFRLGV